MFKQKKLPDKAVFIGQKWDSNPRASELQSDALVNQVKITLKNSNV